MKIADLERAMLVADVVDLDTGEVIIEANDLIPEDVEERLKGRNHTDVELFFPDWDLSGNIPCNTLAKDHTTNAKDALIEIYRRMRPGDPPTLESARSLFYGMFFDAKRYDFSRVGRFKFNIKLDTDVPVDQKTLSADDFMRVAAYFLTPHHRGRRLESTTSTISATGVFARSANCSRTSSGSVSFVWSERSRRRCRCIRISIRRCRTI